MCKKKEIQKEIEEYFKGKKMQQKKWYKLAIRN